MPIGQRQRGSIGHYGGDGMTDNGNDLGRMLKRRRLMMALTLHELGTAAGVSPSHLGRIERGERFPSASILRRIAGFGDDERECRIIFKSADSCTKSVEASAGCDGHRGDTGRVWSNAIHGADAGQGGIGFGDEFYRHGPALLQWPERNHDRKGHRRQASRGRHSVQDQSAAERSGRETKVSRSLSTNPNDDGGITP